MYRNTDVNDPFNPHRMQVRTQGCHGQVTITSCIVFVKSS